MDLKQIEQLLKEADQRMVANASDPAELADRVLKTTRRQRSIHLAASLLLVAGLLGVMLANFPKPLPSPEIAIFPKPPVERRVEDELASIQSEIALRETALQALEAMERRSQLNARLWALPTVYPEQEIVERAAAMVVYQADRMLQMGHDPQPALQAYHEVIDNFPHALSAQTARERVVQIDKAG